MRIVIGIDPDTEKHGVAVYTNGRLADLRSLNLIEIITMILERKEDEEMIFSIENVCANNFVYARNMTKNPKVNMSIARSVGACQQSQTELMRALDHYDITYVLHKPSRSNWAKNKAQFEKATGWNKRSNEDTRSAAYFGCLEI